MIVNALLVCWNGGWFRLDDPAAIAAAGYRAEGFLSLGAQYDEGEAYRQAQQVLADYRETRVGIETRIDPAPPGQGAAAPYQGWRPTNTIRVAGQTHRVRSMRVQLTDDGPEFTPGFGRRAPSESDRLVTAVKKFSPGVMAGDTAIPTPMSPYSAGAEIETTESGDGCVMLAAYGAGRAVVEIESQVPVTVFVSASISGESTVDATGWRFVPVLPEPPPPSGGGAGYWGWTSPVGAVFSVDPAGSGLYVVNSAVVFADTIVGGVFEVGAECPQWLGGPLDEDFKVHVNVSVCPASDVSTVGWVWTQLG